MHCSKCQAENLGDSLFCTQCGARFEATCPSCGAGNPAAANFCRKCGTRLPGARPGVAPAAYTPPHLAARILAAGRALEAHAHPEGERKTITALFADITGSMELMEDLDPEEARRIVDAALRLMIDAVPSVPAGTRSAQGRRFSAISLDNPLCPRSSVRRGEGQEGLGRSSV